MAAPRVNYKSSRSCRCSLSFKHSNSHLSLREKSCALQTPRQILLIYSAPPLKRTCYPLDDNAKQMYFTLTRKLHVIEFLNYHVWPLRDVHSDSFFLHCGARERTLLHHTLRWKLRIVTGEENMFCKKKENENFLLFFYS